MVMGEKFKCLLALAGGTLAGYFKLYLPLIAVVFTAVMFDIITGVAASVYTGEGLSSKRARKGAIKKAVLFLALGFGTFLDFLLPMAASKIGLELKPGILFSSVVAFYIAFCECVSVCENIYRANPDALPTFLKKLLADAKDKIDKGDKK